MKKLISVTLALVMILTCLSGLCFAAEAEARWTNGSASIEGSLTEMVKEASNSGGTITLLKDVTHSAEKGNYLTSNTSFTLDLNGKTVTSNRIMLSVSAKATGVTVIKNGTLISERMNVTVSGGGLQMDGVTCWSDTQQNVSYSDTTGNWNEQNLIENCVFVNNAWGAFSFNNTKESMANTAMVFKNTTLATSKKNAIVVQSKAVTGNAIFGEGMKIYSAGAVAQSAISVTGEKQTKAEGTYTVEAGGKSVTGVMMWTTPEKATKEIELPKVYEQTTGKVASWSDGLTTIEGTLEEVAAQVKKAGGTVTLLADISSNASSGNLFNTKIPFTLDMNGHTITCKIVPVAVTEGAEGTTVIKNGTFITESANVSIYGGLQMQNVTGWSEKSQNINYYEQSDLYNKTNLIENCTFGNPAWGAFSFNRNSSKEGVDNSQEKASMTFKNSTLIAAKGSKGTEAIVHQNKAVSANVAFGEGMKIYSYKTGENDFAYKTLNLLGETVTKS